MQFPELCKIRQLRHIPKNGLLFCLEKRARLTVAGSLAFDLSPGTCSRHLVPFGFLAHIAFGVRVFSGCERERGLHIPHPDLFSLGQRWSLFTRTETSRHVHMAISTKTQLSTPQHRTFAQKSSLPVGVLCFCLTCHWV